MAQLPIFGAGNYKNILNAISNGTISYPAWMFCRDKQMLGFVEPDGSFVLMKGDNKEQVVYVDELPAIKDGDKGVLYIVDTICYKFDGTDYVALGQDHTADIEELLEKVNSLEDATEELKVKVDKVQMDIASLQESSDDSAIKVAELESVVENITVQISDLEERIEALNEESENVYEHLYENVKYEVSSKPIGTLVDYFDKEIRIMCPENTQWAKQNVGSTGNANMYYIGFKAYAPEGAVSFKEGDQGVIIDEMFDFNGDFAGTDKYGRNYSICWLAVAKYDEASDAWIYFGKNSSTSKYVGWTYIVEWYDANGVVIESDSIRINLSNEECHSAVEPFYVSGLLAEVKALKEANAIIVEQLEGMTETLTEVEERIVRVETGNTFVELD